MPKGNHNNSSVFVYYVTKFNLEAPKSDMAHYLAHYCCYALLIFNEYFSSLKKNKNIQ